MVGLASLGPPYIDMKQLHAITLTLLLTALASAADPQLGGISPYGAQRGTEIEVNFNGARLADAMLRTVARGGSVVIPAFAVDRTEVLLMSLRELRQRQAIPDVPIYVDSPMALSALQIYRRAIRRHDPELRDDFADGDPFDPGDLYELRTAEESKTINNPRWPCLIVSASGMATGGRVLHHLEALLPERRNTVVLAGYQAAGTRGRDLLDGVRSVKIHGRDIPVRAEIVDVPFFSVHADAAEVVSWLQQAPRAPASCYAVHGEPDAAPDMVLVRDQKTPRGQREPAVRSLPGEHPGMITTQLSARRPLDPSWLINAPHPSALLRRRCGSVHSH